jgi:hypothetical protein
MAKFHSKPNAVLPKLFCPGILRLRELNKDASADIAPFRLPPSGSPQISNENFRVTTPGIADPVRHLFCFLIQLKPCPVNPACSWNKPNYVYRFSAVWPEFAGNSFPGTILI